MEQNTRTRFKDAKMLKEESCRLYAGRLEKLYRFAYPQKSNKIITSKTLQRKFIETVPEEFSGQLKTARAFNKTMKSCELSWTDMLTLASQYDADSKSYKNKATNNNEIWLAYRPDQKPDDQNVRTSSRSSPPDNPKTSSSSIGDQPRSAPPNSRTSSSGNKIDKRCFYCDKVGHFKSECRRFLRQCLICSSPDHRAYQCPDRREEQGRLSDRQTNSGSQIPSPAMNEDRPGNRSSSGYRTNKVSVKPSGN